jgi:hypothetical protein
MEGKQERKWAQFHIFNVMAKSRISFQSIRQNAWFIWEWRELKLIQVLDSPIMVIKKGVITDAPKDMELEHLM